MKRKHLYCDKCFRNIWDRQEQYDEQDILPVICADCSHEDCPFESEQALIAARKRQAAPASATWVKHRSHYTRSGQKAN